MHLLSSNRPSLRKPHGSGTCRRGWPPAAVFLAVVGMALAARADMIWPTGLGDFLVRVDTAAAAFEAEEPAARGYLAEGPARPLQWREETEAATTTTVLRFGENRVTVSHGSTIAPQQNNDTVRIEAAPSREVVMPAIYEETAPEIVVEDLSAVTETAPERAGRRSVLDEKFVNWVTRRIDDTKVEIPFTLPTEPGEGEPVAPTERVRVRYREEP